MKLTTCKQLTHTQCNRSNINQNQIYSLFKSTISILATTSVVLITSSNAIAYDNINVSSTNEPTILQTSKVEAFDMPASNSNLSASRQNLLSCSHIKSAKIRLSCFDAVSNNKQLTYSQDKKQLDLAKMLKSTFKGHPKIVILETDNQTNDELLQYDYNDTLEKNTNVQEVNNIFKQKQTKFDKQKLLSSESKNNNTIFRTKHTKIKLQKPSTANNYENDINYDDINNTVNNQQYRDYAEKNNYIDINKSKGLENISPLSIMYDLDHNDEIGTWKPRPHNPMYIIPLFMHDNPNLNPSTPSQSAVEYTQNEYRSSELKFQLSFKSKIAQDLFKGDADLWMGYTQQSHWQVYNQDNSRPFRAHDYKPEIFLTQPVHAELPFGGKLRMLGGGFMHHSNGEDDPLSRTWNRAYLMGGAEWDNTWGKVTVMPRIWKRLSAKSKSLKDENSDIEKFYGYGDVKVFYDMNSGQSMSGTFHLNPINGKGSAEIDYVYPMDNNVNLFLNIFHGYGESLVDYNHKDTTFGVGVMLNDWRGL